MRFKIEKLEQFTIMPNYHLQDKNLQLEDKGLLSVFYNLPNEWEYSMEGLCAITNTGIKKIRSILFRLELRGYLEREKARKKNGQIEYIYHIFYKPKKLDYRRTQSYKVWKEKIELENE